MPTTADLEIAALRRGEDREGSKLDEFERLLRRVWPHYACDLLPGDIPDRAWVDPATGLLTFGLPPCDRKGWVVVSLGTLRELARKTP